MLAKYKPGFYLSVRNSIKHLRMNINHFQKSIRGTIFA
jgi:hypothetical protein